MLQRLVRLNNICYKCYHPAILFQNQIPNASPDLATLDVKTNIICLEGQIDLSGQCGESQRYVVNYKSYS